MDSVVPEVGIRGICEIKSIINYLTLLGIKEGQPIMGTMVTEDGPSLFFEARTLLRSVNYDDLVFDLVDIVDQELYEE